MKKFLSLGQKKFSLFFFELKLPEYRKRYQNSDLVSPWDAASAKESDALFGKSLAQKLSDLEQFLGLSRI